jgi:transposase
MLTPQALPVTIPADTAELAKRVFRKGNRYVRLRDELGLIFAEDEFQKLYSTQGAPGVSAVRLALVTLVQYMEELSDREAAEAVRSRIDLKYLLGLELGDEGFDYSVLSEFRQRLLDGKAENQLLDKLLQVCQQQGWLKAGGKQRTDSTHMVGAVRSLSRQELVGETLRAALNTLAAEAPAWLQAQAPAAWYQRYSQRIEAYRLPKSQKAREAWILQVGRDGEQLLAWLTTAEAPAAVQSLPAVTTLRTVWTQQFHLDGTTVRWRQAGELPAARAMVQSPYDNEVRYSEKRTTTWEGYKVHLTESCDEGLPHLITQVTTEEATQPDGNTTDSIQTDLAAKKLLPAQHLVDGGYTDADHYAHSHSQHQLDLVGPTTPDGSWQAKSAAGFDHSHFHLDWDKQQATCPGGKTSQYWLPDAKPASNPTLLIRFHPQDCAACSLRTQCTRSVSGARSLRIRPQAQYDALQAARQRQQTPAFRQLYRQRAGIEGTLSQAIRTADLRFARFIGKAKTHLQNVATAAAINLLRLADFLAGHQPAQTRRSAFARLAPT